MDGSLLRSNVYLCLQPRAQSLAPLLEPSWRHLRRCRRHRLHARLSSSCRPRPQLARTHYSPRLIMENCSKMSSLNQISLQDEVLILGGGVAGCAASIALARKGLSVTLIEREPTPRHKVCGEFLSGEALEDLHALGIDVATLGAVPIDYVRLAAARRAAEAPLPFPAASLTRKALDTALIAEAIAAGVRVERGRSVQSLSL